MIDFTVVRSARRRKTIALYIEPSGDVLVRAPMKTPHSRLRDMVKARAGWIVRKRGFLKETAHQATREFESGETFSYLGRHLSLKIVPDGHSKKPCIRMDGDALEVILDPCRMNGDRPAVIKDAIEQWYRLRAAELVPERVRIYAGKMNLPETEVYIRNQKRIWGSCSTKGVLRFNWRIVMAPVSLVDYLVVHELCHIKQRNHSKSYWKAVGRILPDYKIRRERLRREDRGYQF